jgi:hypothetical protein
MNEDDGVALTSALHPEGPIVAEDRDINESALQEVDAEFTTDAVIKGRTRIVFDPALWRNVTGTFGS